MSDLRNFDLTIADYWMLLPATAVILLLSFLEKRQRRQDLCQGRPALISPFHFLDGYDNRAGYAMAFGAATNVVIDLVPIGADCPPWAMVFYVYLHAIVGCVICFPLFACLTTRYRALGAVICIMYSSLLLSLSLVNVVKTFLSTKSLEKEYDDTVMINLVQACDILNQLSVIFCYLMLIAYCFYILYRCFINESNLNKHAGSTVSPHEFEHVRWALSKFRMKNSDTITNSPSPTFVHQMKRSSRLRYFTNFHFFKYPTRIIALAFVLLNVEYRAGVICILITGSIIQGTTVLKHRDLLAKLLPEGILVHIIVCSIFALVMCILNSLAQIFMGLRNYRYDILRIYQGNRSFIPAPMKTPQNILVSSMTFSGYQVAFMLWGIFLCFFTVLLVTLVPTSFIHYWIVTDQIGHMAVKILSLLSFPVVVFILFYLQVFISKRVLLQEKLKVTDKDPPLNVDNRKLYEVINYYVLLTNMAAGLFTWMRRGLLVWFFGVINLGRLDRSVFPHELVKLDKGHDAYLSMLLVDNAHNNPGMRVFAHLLCSKLSPACLQQDPNQNISGDEAVLASNPAPRRARMCRDYIRWFISHGISFQVQENHAAGDNPATVLDENHASRRARIHWHLAYTLIHNPHLSSLRKATLNTARDPELSTGIGARGGDSECTEICLSMEDSEASPPWNVRLDKKSSEAAFTDLGSLSASSA